MSIAVVSILPGASPRLGPNAVARRRVSIRGGRQSSAAPIVLRAMAAPAGAHVSGAPADLSDDAVRSMRDEAVSWAAQHGLLVGLESDESGRAMCASFTHAPMSLLPTPFPRDVFELALRVSPSFAALSDAVSRDDEFLRTTLAGVVKTDDFTRRIWDIYERCGGQEGRHPMELGILRSDYMLDEPSGLPLQVEVNTVSTSFMALSTKVGEMHRHTISHAGLVRHYADEDADEDEDVEKDEDANLDDEAKLQRVLPLNRALECAADTLAAGWRAMNDDDAKILFVVQPNERNVFDQRIIAQRLWTKHGIASIRATLREIDANAAVDQTTKRLTYGASDGGATPSPWCTTAPGTRPRTTRARRNGAPGSYWRKVPRSSRPARRCIWRVARRFSRRWRSPGFWSGSWMTLGSARRCVRCLRDCTRWTVRRRWKR